MSQGHIEVKEILPSTGYLYEKLISTPILCKPKIMPLKSLTLQKLETIQSNAQNLCKIQSNAEQTNDLSNTMSDKTFNLPQI